MSFRWAALKRKRSVIRERHPRDRVRISRGFWIGKAQVTVATYRKFSEATRRSRPTPWGLHNVLGNVWEWVSDWYDESYYAASPKRDPRGPFAGEGRVVRGGSWTSYAGILRLSHRVKFAPDHCYEALGFRCIRDQTVQDREPD